MLARLAHFIARQRWYVIGVWIVLTLFGGFAAGQVSKRWYQSFSIPGKSAYEANQRDAQDVRHRRPPAERRRLPHERRRDEERRDQAGDAPRGERLARLADELVLLDRQLDVRLEGPAHDLHGGLPGREVRRSTRRAAPRRRARPPRRAARRHHGPRDRPRSARGSDDARLERRPERAPRGGGRRPRRAGHPASSSSGRCRRC